MIRFLALTIAAGLAASAAQAQSWTAIGSDKIDEAAFDFQATFETRPGVNMPLIPQLLGAGLYDAILCNTSAVEGGYDGPSRIRQVLPPQTCAPLYGVGSIHVWSPAGKPDWRGRVFMRPAKSPRTP